MRRHVATLVAAALLLSFAGPVAAGAGGDRASATTAGAAAAVDTADPQGRWIVLYKGGTDAAAATEKRSVRVGFRADRTFTHGIRGFAAELSDDQVADLRADAAVAAVIPDERVEPQAQILPTGVSRIGGKLSQTARIDGVDDRVDADVAIVDTGIAKLADLNVAGGYNCSTSNHSLWRDVHGHGTHVAGTVGAKDNGSGVVGVAPGVRLWAVKILDDSGAGLLSWYVCGLDWITAQRDPSDPSRPRIEAINMSVAKWGNDTPGCGASAGDILHAAICRLVDDGITVVAAAANDSGNAAERVPAAYDEVITVSALADSDGKPGALGGNRCFSWGTYDNDDTFANFSNYGADVDLIAPGKCIYSTVPGGLAYSSGTSMAAPHVAGAAALVKAARPYFTPAEVKEALQYLGTLDWKVTSDPDSVHEKLLDVSRLGPRGDFSLAAMNVPSVTTSGGVVNITVQLTRTNTAFERIALRSAHLPPGVRATFAIKSLYGFEDLTATMKVDVADGLAPGTYHLTVVGTEHGRQRETTATFQVTGSPVPPPPTRLAPPVGITGEAPPPPRTVTTGSGGVRGLTGASIPDPTGRDTAAVSGASEASTGPEPSQQLEPLVEVSEPGAAPAPAAVATRAHIPSRIVFRYTFVTAR